MDTIFVNAVKAQTSRLVSFEYINGGLKIRPGWKSYHINIVTILRDTGVEFYTSNPSPEQQVRYVFRGLPPSKDSNEFIAGLREKGSVVCNARQIKRSIIIGDDRAATLLSL